MLNTIKRIKDRGNCMKVVFVHLTCTYKNTLVTCSEKDNVVFFQASSRSHPIKLKRKNNSLVLYQICKNVITVLRRRNGHMKLKNLLMKVIIKGVGQGRYHVIKHLGRRVKIASINDITSVPFNGCRQQKKKRR